MSSNAARSVKEARFRRKLVQREERNAKYAINEFEGTVKSLENEVLTIISLNLSRAHYNFVRWKAAQVSNYQDKLTDFTSVWVHWLHYDILNYEKEFEGRPINIEREKQPSAAKLRTFRSAEQFWSSFNIYDDILPLIWRIRFTVAARLILLKMVATVREPYLRRIVNFATGYINPSKAQGEINCKLVQYGPCTDMAFFTSLVGDFYLLFCVELNRIPHVSNHNLIYYSLEQHLKVVAIVEKYGLAVDAMNRYLNTIKSNPDLYIENENCDNFALFSYSENVMRKMGQLNFPKVPSNIYLTSSESESMVFSPKLKRWIPNADSPPIYIDMFSTSHPLIKKLASEEAGTNFVKLLTSIPNFRIQLTEEQKATVSSGDNIVILGRSGTGKTTCALLRMFAAELLFRFKAPRASRRFGPEDVGKTSVLHTAFVTASPVLTNEVKRFYGKINEHVKLELEKKIKRGEAREMDVVNLENEEVVGTEVHSESDSESDPENEEKGPSSMNLLRDEDFPLFFTVRRLVFVVDASLRRPFFARDIMGRVIGSGTNFEWHNEYKGSLRISKDYKNHLRKTHQFAEASDSDSDEALMDEAYYAEARLKQYEQVRKRGVRNRSFEVDYQVFKEKFWPKIKTKTRLSALVVWTEITAYIKGSATSYMYSGYYLPKVVYANRGQKVSLLTREEKADIWELFILYERWKVSCSAYDFQDIVNYILGQVKYYGYSGVPIHYMMVDEVQDLTPGTIALLMAITKEKLVFSGDTAQTIAKGVGFRFCDLETLFYESELAKPNIYQLTMNFRTHNQILGLANSIVALLEALFPQTIDKMGKEVSDIDGPMPKIIVSPDHVHLFYLLFGFEKDPSKSEVQFGCNQVIIVRNQDAKKKLHPLLSHALCLTVFEAKGLEFDDVILYNFFTDSEVSAEKWRVLSTLKKLNENIHYRPKNFADLENSVPKLRSHSTIDQSKLSLLCTELKHLYVAVTRPKKNLVIFDEDPASRRYMQDYWDYMEVVEFVEGEDLCNQLNVKNLNIVAIAQRTSAEAWQLQGQRMMSHKFYDQAAKCFSVSGDLIMEKKALAFSKATWASELTNEADALEEDFTGEKKTKKEKAEIREKRNKAAEMFREAAEALVVISREEGSRGLLKQAAQCFASSKDFLQAAKVFEEIGFKGQAAESYFSCGEYEKASEFFNEKGDYVRAIECYSLCQQWEKIIYCLNKHKNLIPEEERKKYVYKYMPVALEALIPKILPNENSNYIRKIVQEQKNVIKEAMEEEEDDEEDEEEEEEKRQEENDDKDRVKAGS